MKLDEEDVEAIAQRVAELVRDPASRTAAVRLVDARTVAQAVGVNREWVYAHSTQLGAIRLGGGRGRLRFDLKHVQDVLAISAPKPQSATRRRTRAWSRRCSGKRVDLLPYES